MKDDILCKSSMYQIGGQPGHSIEEHLFTIKSMIELFEMKNQGMIFILVDLVSFFDQEAIHDVIATMQEVGVNSAAVRMWFKLNQNTEIQVNASAGILTMLLLVMLLGRGLLEPPWSLS